jgi:hypothetical protein
MDKVISWLSGASGAAGTTGGYYQNAANDVFNLYGPSATNYFTREQNRALQSQFNTQDQQMVDSLAAKGLARSGAGQYNFGNLGAQQSGVIAGADAPIFSQGLAGAANIYGQMPGAQSSAYQNAIDQFYQALGTAGSAFGMGGLGGGGGGGGYPTTSAGGWTGVGPPGTNPGVNPMPNQDAYYGGGAPYGGA